MNINLSEHFNYRKLIKFTLPTIAMMIFTSIYGVVDGLFISNVVGSNAFASVNLVMPVVMILGTIGFMIGTGGSALVSRIFGAGHDEKANQYFSMLVYLEIILGVIFTIIGLIFLEPITKMLGANESMMNDCLSYGKVLLLGLVPFILQNSFQSFIVVAEKPHFGLLISVITGVTNMVLDFLFVYVFRGQVVGAAAATITSQIVGAVILLIYFGRKNETKLRIGKPYFELKPIIQACINGSSEMVTNLSLSIISILFNIQLMKYVGANGVAAYGIIMYVGYLFVGTYVGYSVGIAPVVSFHFGANHKDELKSLLNKSIKLLGVVALVMTLLSEVLAKPLASIFVGYDQSLLDLTVNALRLYSLSYIISWFNIFASAFFTALNNGGVSALISFLRTLVFQAITIILLPVLLGLNGIWLSVLLAEILSLIVSIACFILNKKKYEYV